MSVLASPTSEEGETFPTLGEMLPLRVLKEGYLRKQSQNLSRDWNRRFFQLTPTALLYYRSEESRHKVRGHIPLISASVKGPAVPAVSSSSEGERPSPVANNNVGRRVRLLTPTREYLLEAESGEEAQEWTNAIAGAIQGAIMAGSSILRVQSPIAGLQLGSGELARLIRSIPDAGNDRCADCGTGGTEGSYPTWVSINLGVVLCINCSGVHRSLGCQISKVRSLELDSFLPETLAVIRLLGNKRMNAIWEAMDAPPLSSPLRVDRTRFIQQKYIERTWTGEQSLGPSPLEAELRGSGEEHGVPEGGLAPSSSSSSSPAAEQPNRKRATHQPTLSPLGQPKSPSCLFSPELAFFEGVRGPNILHTATLLFRHGIDVNLTEGATGLTALHMAAGAGQLLQVHFLMLNGADLGSRERGGRTATEVAREAGHGEVVEHLIKVAGPSGLGRVISAEARHDSLTEARIRRALMMQPDHSH